MREAACVVGRDLATTEGTRLVAPLSNAEQMRLLATVRRMTKKKTKQSVARAGPGERRDLPVLPLAERERLRRECFAKAYAQQAAREKDRTQNCPKPNAR